MTNLLSALPWAEVIAVGIRTTAGGPLVDDLFWQFLLADRCLEVPGSLIDGAAFDELSHRLPGIDHMKVIRATGSTAERIYRVWHRDESRYSPGDEELAARYLALVGRLGGSAETARAAFDRVRAAWGADGRCYHGVEHLVDCLRELDAASADPATADVVELALWYHDVVHDPCARDAEERSARRLIADAEALAIPAGAARTAAELVRSTAHAVGATTPASLAAELIADIDLSILGRDALRFMDYEYGVEEEHARMGTLRFRIARGAFLAGLLARPHLFHTEAFRARYEQRARAQLTSLLASPRYRGYRWLRWLPPLRG
jgi:predicted metal-dependent HD superfamily phosphohydrolase